MSPGLQPGIHLVHKPVGPTSFSVVQGFPRAARSMCHGGTLDPFAHGLLLILVEPATRLFDYLHAIPKVYEATIRWGVETDNGDPLGRLTFSGDASGLSPQQLQDMLQTFTGWQNQTPPATSAKRIDGERAYAKAHRGEAVRLPPSSVYLHEAQWLDHELPAQSRLRITVRGGFYVRALARDLGRRLGCGAHLTTLHRTAIGPWLDPGPDRTVSLRGRDILPWAFVRQLTDAQINDLRNHRTIPLGDPHPPDWPLPRGFPDPQAPIRGFHQGRFCFLLAPDEGRLCAIAPMRGGL